MIVFPVAADPVGASIVDSLPGRARIGRFPHATTVTADGSQLTHRGGGSPAGDSAHKPTYLGRCAARSGKKAPQKRGLIIFSTREYPQRAPDLPSA
jgi:hypothetical protein